MNNRNLLIIACISGFMAVALGAFGAHGLKPHLDSYQSEIWQKAVFYQFVHTLAMLFSILWNLTQNSKIRLLAALSFALGILCFSGSLYFLATRHLLGLEHLKVGIITPIGGVFFLIGWAILAIEARKLPI